MKILYAFAEVLENGKWVLNTKAIFSNAYGVDIKETNPFNFISDNLMMYLCNFNNESRIPYRFINKGFPQDSEYLNQEIPILGRNDEGDRITLGKNTRREDLFNNKGTSHHNHVYLDTLLIDHNQTFIDAVDDTEKTYEDFLGNTYMQHLKELQELGEPKEVRIVYFIY